MATGQDTILNTDKVVDALVTKINDDMAELFAAVAALTAGSGVLTSAADTTQGYLATKIEGLAYEIDSPAADENFRVHLPIIHWWA